MKKYLITEEDKGELIDFLKTHNSHKAIKILNELEEYNNPLKEKLRKFLRNKGRSTILHSEINGLLDEEDN